MQLYIPEEFRADLHHVEASDTRTDEEILDSLSRHESVASEKNIWTFWHSGVRSMPGWCQRNVVNWVRLCGSSWSIRVLDMVPGSPNNALKWVPEEMLPEAFVKGTMDGSHNGPHSADFLRGACLHLYGGVWMDVGILLFRHLDDVCWRQLEDHNSPFEVSVPWMYGTVMANHFVASRKGNPFIKRWHDIFVHLWKNRTNGNGIIEDPLVSFGKEVKLDNSRARNFRWDFSVEPRKVLEYIGQVLAWTRLCRLEDPTDGFNGAEYYGNKVLLFDALSEDYGAEEEIGWSGQEMFDVLATKRDIDRESEEYRKAYRTVWKLLTRSSMQKVTTGKHLMRGLALGGLLNMKENEGIDIEPGTFAELLRYGSVHFEQTRETIKYVKAVTPEIRVRKGLLEP